MKGDEKLWEILGDKLETLRATEQLPEAIRIAETALDLAQRAFAPESPQIAFSFERLGQLRDQRGDRAGAKPVLEQAHRLFEKFDPPDLRCIYRSGRRLAYLSDELGQQNDAIQYYKRAIQVGIDLGDVPHSDLGTMLNNLALIYRKSGQAKAAEP